MPTMRSAWAEALGSAGGQDPASVQELVAPLEQMLSGKVSGEHLVPAVSYLQHCGGQHADLVCSALSKALQQMASTCDQPATATDATAFRQSFQGLTSVILSPDISLSARAQVSQAADALLKAMLTSCFSSADKDGSKASPKQGGLTLSKCVMRAVLDTQQVPLLPSQALHLLAWSYTNLLEPIETPGASLDKVLLEQLLACMAAVANAARLGISTLADSPAGTLSLRQNSSKATLPEIVDWCRQIIQDALQSFTTGSTPGRDNWGGGITTAAARLCMSLIRLGIQLETAEKLASTPKDPSTTANGSRHLSKDAVAESFRSSYSSAPLQAEEVVDEILALADAAVSAATGNGRAATAVTASGGACSPGKMESQDKVLHLADLMLEGLSDLLAYLAAQGAPLAMPLSQLRGMLLTVSASMPSIAYTEADVVAASPSTPSSVHNARDVVSIIASQPRKFTSSYVMTDHNLEVFPSSPSVVASGAMGLLHTLTEHLAAGLCAAWVEGQQSFVQAMLVPPEPSISPPSEVKALARVTARVYAILNAEPHLSRFVLPLLIDSVASSLSTAGTRAASASVALRPDVFACLASTLAGMGACSASNKGRHGQHGAWAYEQVCDVLLRSYREAVRATMSGGSVVSNIHHPLEKGPALAAALTQLASQLSTSTTAEQALRRDLRNRLLSLFHDLALAIKSGDVTPLGQLLPALAAACEGQGFGGSSVVASHTKRNLMSRSKFSYADLERTNKDEGNSIKLLRSFWLHVALHGLAAPSSPEAWRAAVGQVAAASPVLLAGLGTGNDADMLEHLKAELGEQLVVLGSIAEPARLRAVLLETLALASAGPANYPGALEAVSHAYLLSVACCELSRAVLAPLPTVGPTCPLSVTLAYLQVTRTHSQYCSWYARITECAFTRYIKAISDSRGAASGSPAGSPGSVADGDIASSSHPSTGHAAVPAQDCLEQLAVTLIFHLVNFEAHQEGTPSQVVQTSQQLLLQLLSRFPALYFSPACLQALLAMLQHEEGDRPLGTLRGSTSQAGASSVVWKVLRAWISNAAMAAPAYTEALLHQFLEQETAGPAAPLVTSNASILNTTLSSRAATTHAAANAAALRRATDLLGIVSSARSEVESAGSASVLDTTQAMCCKQYYKGLVAGMQQARPSTAGASPSVPIVRDLIHSLRNHDALPVLQQNYLCAAAVLADAQPRIAAKLYNAAVEGTHDAASHDGDLSCLADPVNMELLHSLCAVPLTRFTPEVMSLALFAWTWVSASSPAWPLPLASKAVSAWCQSVDQGAGLFSGKQWADSSVTGSGMDVLLHSLACHLQWLNFFTELWETVADRTDTDQAHVLRLLQNALHHALTRPERLCCHPAAAAPYFKLLYLAAAVVNQGHISAEQSSQPRPPSMLLLQDRFIKAGLNWFMGRPGFSAHLSEQQCADQVAVLRSFMLLLTKLLANREAWSAALPKPRVHAPALHKRLHTELTATVTEPEGQHHPKKGGVPAVSQFKHPVWGHADTSPSGAAAAGGGSMGRRAATLLLFLCQRELERLQVWADPMKTAADSTLSVQSIPAKDWEEYAETAWLVSPVLAVSLADRFPGSSALYKAVIKHLVKDVWRPDVQAMPQAAIMLATSQALSKNAPELLALSTWAAGDAAAGLQLISSHAGNVPSVRAYAVRCLENTPADKVTFFLPQLVQCLRKDKDGAIAGALLHLARQSDLFAHQMVWALQTEEKPPPEAFNPEVKRSGWQPPQDCGLWEVAGSVRQRLLSSLSPERLQYWQEESDYFDKVTSISGILKKVERDERRGAIAAKLVKFGPTRTDLYVPTNPECRVIKHIPNSGTPMQSAAKVPILVAFEIEQQDRPIPEAFHASLHAHPARTHDQLQGRLSAGAGAAAAASSHTRGGSIAHSLPTNSNLLAGLEQEAPVSTVAVQLDSNTNNVDNGNTHPHANGHHDDHQAAEDDAVSQDLTTTSRVTRKLACIFKVGDDVRQDVLALQVIHLLRDAFQAAGLPAYLCPYGCLPTGYERGIIEVVPNTKSRAAMGEMSGAGLYDIFQAHYGAPGSPAFEAARQNFIVSEAGYAIASFLLQAKDRHNGNLLVSKEGHLVHIDFGFILEISPGGNLGFESAAFKLSHEMTQLLDPGGGRNSSTWKQFEELCIRSYLVARTVAEPIIATVALMADSGLPCFGRGQPIPNLRKRFQLELSERQAADFMRGLLNDAYQKWTTGFYDFIQALQNRIPY